MPLPSVTLVGNLTADPELRFTPSGKAVVNFTVACSERRKNQQTDEWEDGDSIFIRCSAWEQVAENIAENCLKGTSVMVTGVIFQRQYETREGEKRYSFEARVYSFGVQISKSQSAKPSKMQRGTQYGDPQSNDGPPPAEDPWASSPSGGNQYATSSAGNGQFSDEPPFAAPHTYSEFGVRIDC